MRTNVYISYALLFAGQMTGQVLQDKMLHFFGAIEKNGTICSDSKMKWLFLSVTKIDRRSYVLV